MTYANCFGGAEGADVVAMITDYIGEEFLIQFDARLLAVN